STTRAASSATPCRKPSTAPARPWRVAGATSTSSSWAAARSARSSPRTCSSGMPRAAVASWCPRRGRSFFPPPRRESAHMGGAPDLRVPWVNHPSLNYAGLIFAVGGRSLTWGGWSPELLDVEMTAWPQAARDALRPAIGEGYFAQASRQIGVKETNDFIYGP